MIFLVPLAVVLVIGGLLAGGIFTIVFLPIAVIIIVSAILFTMWGRKDERPTAPSERPSEQSFSANQAPNSAPTPSTPDQLVDARRATQ
ncbi:MAG TPA: hypothetical protein VHX62_17865 [Solirubrobacteraceae bacterium]|nr:hypothetical protein [Solirubrobacteraceae bacterium]